MRHVKFCLALAGTNGRYEDKEISPNVGKKSVQTFVRSMEAKKYYKNDFISIFSLMRDGRELTEKLKSITMLQNDAEKVIELQKYIQPYLQFVNVDKRCELTGLRLCDIWRYFRYTWANPYKTVPGRNMMILVRDAATPFHAVIGIASLSSATVGNNVRDKYLGWTKEAVSGKLKTKRSVKFVHWMFTIVDKAINELYKSDLYADEHNPIMPKDLSNPSKSVIQKLITSSEKNRQNHYQFVQTEEFSTSEQPEAKATEYWEKQARTALFRSKRELELANLLKVRMVLKECFSKAPTQAQLEDFLYSSRGRDALAKIVRRAKAERVGTLIADLSICGAIPPYNEILGGKLVAMLVTSPEVVNEYKRKYGKQPSIIASSMAGRPIIRTADLVFINTTSLFGQRPNQYDRIRVPCCQIVKGSKNIIRYRYLGQTEGVGTFHFSEQTVRELSILVGQGKRGERVHSIFGEGVNPRMRKIRDGLDALGVPTDDILTHGVPRIVYGVRLISNLTEYLLGMNKRPNYYLPRRYAKGASDKITLWWLARWVRNRITRKDVLRRIESHTLVRPIRHGARVKMPRTNIGQGLLFEY